MADGDAPMKALKAFLEFIPTVEKLAQDSATTEAVLYATDKSDEWKKLARFEYELQYEIECWEGIRRKIDERVADRQVLLDEQVRKRQAARDV